jgi:hypothetical protein
MWRLMTVEMRRKLRMSDDRVEMAWMDPFDPCFPCTLCRYAGAYVNPSCLVYLVTEMFSMEAIRHLNTPDKGLNQLTRPITSSTAEARALTNPLLTCSLISIPERSPFPRHLLIASRPLNLLIVDIPSLLLALATSAVIGLHIFKYPPASSANIFFKSTSSLLIQVTTINSSQNKTKASLLNSSNHGRQREARLYLQVRREACLHSFQWLPSREPRGIPESWPKWPSFAARFPSH